MVAPFPSGLTRRNKFCAIGIEMNLPKKIFIVGISGAGKTYFARKLSGKLHIPLYHMDSIIWRHDWAEAAENEIICKLKHLESQDAWIIDGWIDEYSQKLLDDADVIFYLDFSRFLAVSGVISRWFKYRKSKRAELPDGCLENFDFKFILNVLFKKEKQHIDRILSSVSCSKIVKIKTRMGIQKFI